VLESEYEGSARGINRSFGDRIGARSKIYLRSSSDGNLYIGIRSVNGFPDNENDGAVMYIDSAPGGFANTGDLTDYTSVPRGLVSGLGAKSGKRALLTFPSGFEADYAVYVRYHDAGAFRLSAASHELIGAAQANASTTALQYVQSNGTNLELRVPLEPLALTPGSTVKFIVTLLNGSDGYRSDEFVGVTTYPAGSIGQKSATLSAGDGMMYVPAAAAP
jgi:hypothetical protein